MPNIHTELPCGSSSKGYDIDDEFAAPEWFKMVADQLRAMSGLVIDVVMTEVGIEIQRERIGDA